jgi:hypothetical protein
VAGSTTQQRRNGREEPERLDLGQAERRSSSGGLGDVQIAFVEGFGPDARKEEFDLT